MELKQYTTYLLDAKKTLLKSSFSKEDIFLYCDKIYRSFLFRYKEKYEKQNISYAMKLSDSEDFLKKCLQRTIDGIYDDINTAGYAQQDRQRKDDLKHKMKLLDDAFRELRYN